MTTRSEKRKAAVGLFPARLETLLADNSQAEDLKPGRRKNPRTHSENLDDIKLSLRKGIMSNFTKILAENRNEMLKLIATTIKNPTGSQALENTDSEPESPFPTNTSTPIRPKTTTRKTTPVNSRNTFYNC